MATKETEELEWRTVGSATLVLDDGDEIYAGKSVWADALMDRHNEGIVTAEENGIRAALAFIEQDIKTFNLINRDLGANRAQQALETVRDTIKHELLSPPHEQ